VHHALRVASLLLVVAGVLAALPRAPRSTPAVGPHTERPTTWADGVGRLLHTRCVECHRPEAARLPAARYGDAAPRAKRIAAAAGRG